MAKLTEHDGSNDQQKCRYESVILCLQDGECGFPILRMMIMMSSGAFKSAGSLVVRALGQ